MIFEIVLDNLDILLDNLDIVLNNLDIILDNLDIILDNLDIILDNLDIILDNLDIDFDNLDIVLNSLYNIDIVLDNQPEISKYVYVSDNFSIQIIIMWKVKNHGKTQKEKYKNDWLHHKAVSSIIKLCFLFK